MLGVEEISEQGQDFLRRAIELAWEAKRSGNPPFGSLLVDANGTVLAEMSNTTVSDQNLSAHPELKLAVWAGRHLSSEQARATTMYTSAENCAMCSGAFAIAGLGKLVFALSGDQLREARGTGNLRSSVAISSRSVLEQANYPITIVGPALPDEGRAVHLP